MDPAERSRGSLDSISEHLYLPGANRFNSSIADQTLPFTRSSCHLRNIFLFLKHVMVVSSLSLMVENTFYMTLYVQCVPLIAGTQIHGCRWRTHLQFEVYISICKAWGGCLYEVPHGAATTVLLPRAATAIVVLQGAVRRDALPPGDALFAKPQGRRVTQCIRQSTLLPSNLCT